MKDFEVKMWKYKWKMVSEIIPINPKYFIWLYHKLWTRAHTEEYCFCMEEIWKKTGKDINELVYQKKVTLKNTATDREIEKTRSFHHLWDGRFPEHIPESKVTQEMLDKEDDWMAENHEYIATQK